MTKIINIINTSLFSWKSQVEDGHHKKIQKVSFQ